MKIRFVAPAILGLSALLHAGVDDLQVITLKDKSTIRARVVEMSEGVYHAWSPSLGELKIPSSEILSIDAKPAAPDPVAQFSTGQKDQTPAAPEISPDDLAGLQSAVSSKVMSLVTTREGKESLMAFSKNPEVKAVLNDPQVMQAIKSGDYTALMNSPAVKQLLDEPQTKALVQRVMDQKPAAPAALTPAGPPSPTE